MAKIIADKQKADLDKRDEKIIDPYACKLSDIPNSVTEEDIEVTMTQKFGKVKRCRIPTDKDRGRPLGFAIVVFEKMADASRAISEGEVNVDMACLTIETAMKGKKPTQDKNPGYANEQFDLLRRRK